MPIFDSRLVHLILRGRRAEALVQDEEDWRALATMAERMLFWCGGWIHGCRCEGTEIRFAIEAASTSVACMVRHLSGAYAVHLSRRRGWRGGVFKHYLAFGVDAELYLDDLVIWLHRPAPSSLGNVVVACWTADRAYQVPQALPWVTTERVLAALGGSGILAYRRGLTRPMASELVAVFARPGAARSRCAPAGSRGLRASRADADARAEHSRFETIAEFVAQTWSISSDELLSKSRKRTVTRAKAIAAVLSTRNGATAAAMARLFGCSRSTLTEQVEHYRQTQPQLFIDAQRKFSAYLARAQPSIPADESADGLQAHTATSGRASTRW